MLFLSPLMVLFGVAAIGYLVGKVRVFGFSFGIAAVLFAGLGVGWLLPDIALPEFVVQLGLVLFVYTLGLSSGPGFFAALKLKGLRDNALALAVVSGCFGLAALFSAAAGLQAAQAAGVFAGALTNTPALAGVVESLQRSGRPADVLAVPVVAYSLSYPLGVILPMLAVWWAKRAACAAPQAAAASPEAYPAAGSEPIVNVTVLVDRAPTMTARELRRAHDRVVNFGRLRRDTNTDVVHDDTVFLPGDLVTVIGTKRDVEAAARVLGTPSNTHIDLDRSKVDYRRMFVSRPDVTCRPLRELRLIQNYDAVITRVRRGDIELAPHGDFELQLGDRARVVAPRARMAEVEKLLGDSQRAVAEVDVITFSLGITLGLALGAAPFPLPGGGSFRLGLAGGPLIAGLFLGRLGRTGPLVWTLPFGANLALRQFGLVLFLAGVGVRAGGSLARSSGVENALAVVLVGAALTLMSATAAILVGHRLLKIPLDLLVGTLSGIQTQPAVLAFAVEKSGNDLPNVGYTTVYPFATIAKIILSQVLLRFVP